MSREFEDRTDAGRRLGARLAPLRAEDVVVFGLPRGGVPVAAQVAEALDAPLDIVVVRKLGVPSQPELAMGAIGESGTRVLDRGLIARLGIGAAALEGVERRERRILTSRVRRLRPDAGRPDVEGRLAVIVDDGIATGATASVACAEVRGFHPARIIVAAPVAAADADRSVRGADEVVCLLQPPGFRAVGLHYRVFGQTSEAEVDELLDAARRRRI